MGECLIMRRGGETRKVCILDESYPKDVSKTVIKGSTTSATFNVVISEAGNPAEYTYQWYVNGSKVSGATGSSYTMSDLSATATYSVCCEVTNKAGTVTSRVATLKVTQHYTPVLNTSYPSDVSNAEVGGSATFEVAIETAGNPATYTYQWYVNGAAVSGATSASYTVTGLTLGTYTVYCKVTNAAGTVQSRTATLTVNTLYLFKAGDECTPVTGGWVSSAQSSNGYNTITPEKSNSGGILKATYSNPENYRSGLLRTTNDIDLASYSKLYFNITGAAGYANEVGVYTISGATYTKYASTDATSARGLVSIDVSNLDSSYKIALMISSLANEVTHYISVSEVYLRV